MATLVQASVVSESRAVKRYGTAKPSEMTTLRWFDVGLAVAALLLLVGVIGTASVEVQAIALAVAVAGASVGATWYLNRRRNS
ncbi:hypothetical protein [Brooklawnia sp.]|uniref:hypothetical protein n=1 Tax=Brooklawnia sp. TaxID=2699740 RepID=UPI00311E61DE